MSAAEKPRMTEEEYLAFEAASDTKHEFVNGEIVAMAGAGREHSLIRECLSSALQVALASAGKPCVTHSSDMRVSISETGLYAYPDVTVVCGGEEFDRRMTPPSLLNPTVVFEVLSESTEAYDRGAKAAHYRSRASLREYVLVSSTERKVEVIRRGDKSGWWESAIFTGDDVVPLASLGIEVPLAAIYRQLDLIAPPA
jgi:Uma2 family endonuclease